MPSNLQLIIQGLISVFVIALYYYEFKKITPETREVNPVARYAFNFRASVIPVQIAFPFLVVFIISVLWISYFVRGVTSEGLNPCLFFLEVILVQPLFEELLFRGILLGAIIADAEKTPGSKNTRILIGILLAGLLFGLWHYIGKSFVLGGFLIRTGNGILYGLFFWWSGKNLLSSYSAHFSSNFAPFLFAYGIL